MKTCSHEGCNRVACVRGRCKQCYKDMRAHQARQWRVKEREARANETNKRQRVPPSSSPSVAAAAGPAVTTTATSTTSVASSAAAASATTTSTTTISSAPATSPPTAGVQQGECCVCLDQIYALDGQLLTCEAGHHHCRACLRLGMPDACSPTGMYSTCPHGIFSCVMVGCSETFTAMQISQLVSGDREAFNAFQAHTFRTRTASQEEEDRLARETQARSQPDSKVIVEHALMLGTTMWCPECGVLVEKSAACIHMECKACAQRGIRTSFCYVCGGGLDVCPRGADLAVSNCTTYHCIVSSRGLPLLQLHIVHRIPNGFADIVL